MNSITLIFIALTFLPAIVFTQANRDERDFGQSGASSTHTCYRTTFKDNPNILTAFLQSFTLHFSKKARAAFGLGNCCMTGLFFL